MYKDAKIWREMGNAVKIKKLGKNNIYSSVIKKFSLKHGVDTLVLKIKSLWPRKLEE